jgi:hypothetical protein
VASPGCISSSPDSVIARTCSRDSTGGVPLQPSNSRTILACREQAMALINPKLLTTRVSGALLIASPSAGVELILTTYAVNAQGALTQTRTTPAGPCCHVTTVISEAGRFASNTYIAAAIQAGTQQTDVFAVDKTGVLTLYSQTGSSPWSAARSLSSANHFASGAPLAIRQQYGLTQTDVFAVDSSGALTVTWVDGTTWQGPMRISQTGVFPSPASVAAVQQVPLAQTDVFAIGKNGALMLAWVDSASAWQGPVAISPTMFAKPGDDVCTNAQPSQNQTNVCVVDTNNKTNHFWVVGAGAWNGPVLV